MWWFITKIGNALEFVFLASIIVMGLFWPVGLYYLSIILAIIGGVLLLLTILRSKQYRGMRRDIRSFATENKKLRDENTWLRNQVIVVEKRYNTFVNSGLFADDGVATIRGEEPFPKTLDEKNSIILDCTSADVSTDEAISDDSPKN